MLRWSALSDELASLGLLRPRVTIASDTDTGVPIRITASMVVTPPMVLPWNMRRRGRMDAIRAGSQAATQRIEETTGAVVDHQ